MARETGFCFSVMDGDTFETHLHTVVLARVRTPPLSTPEGHKAKRKVASMILNRFVSYEIVSKYIYHQYIAEVWCDDININDQMISEGYAEKVD